MSGSELSAEGEADNIDARFDNLQYYITFVETICKRRIFSLILQESENTTRTRGLETRHNLNATWEPNICYWISTVSYRPIRVLIVSLMYNILLPRERKYMLHATVVQVTNHWYFYEGSKMGSQVCNLCTRLRKTSWYTQLFTKADSRVQ